MTVWDLLQYAAWALSAVIIGWLLLDAYRTGRDHDEEFLTHTIEDFGEDPISPAAAREGEDGR